LIRSTRAESILKTLMNGKKGLYFSTDNTY